MFDLSLAELGLIVVVAVIFIGPEELPVVIRAISKGLRAIRGLTKELRAAFDDLSQESGLKDVAADMHMIKGDDGNMYESYHPVHISNAPKNPAPPKEPLPLPLP